MVEVVLTSKADQIRWLDKYLHTLTLTSPFFCNDPGNIFLGAAQITILIMFSHELFTYVSHTAGLWLQRKS